MKKTLLLLFTLFSFLILGCNTRGGDDLSVLIPDSIPQLQCRSSVLLEAETLEVLYENNAHEVIPPASMTKLAAMWVVLEGVHQGVWSLSDRVPVSPAGDYRSQPPRSSLMFLEAGDEVTLRELLMGLAVPSGNDSAVVVAEYTWGSVAAFVQKMNEAVKSVGLDQTCFVEPSGYSSQNQTTAMEYAIFSAEFLKRYPEAVDELCNLTDFTYPLPQNIPPGRGSSIGPVKQPNHNELVGRFSGLVGLKTGYIDESGYNVALAARRGDTSLVAVLMGGPGDTPKQRSLSRAVDAASLLTWGFGQFVTIKLAGPEGLTVASRQGALAVQSDYQSMMTLKRQELDQFEVKYRLRKRVRFRKGELKRNVGTWECFNGNSLVAAGRLYVESEG